MVLHPIFTQKKEKQIDTELITSKLYHEKYEKYSPLFKQLDCQYICIIMINTFITLLLLFFRDIFNLLLDMEIVTYKRST